MPYKNKEDRNRSSQKWRKNHREQYRANWVKWREDNPRTYKLMRLVKSAKIRARELGIDFDPDIKSVLVFPEFCPLLGIRINYEREIVGPDSPSVDRIDPTSGYVQGNVWVISFRANTIKSNASLDELEALVLALRRHYGR